jgi:hypothetical protein
MSATDTTFSEAKNPGAVGVDISEFRDAQTSA